jgi:hypothetical protein
LRKNCDGCFTAKVKAKAIELSAVFNSRSGAWIESNATKRTKGGFLKARLAWPNVRLVPEILGANLSVFLN